MTSEETLTSERITTRKLGSAEAVTDAMSAAATAVVCPKTAAWLAIAALLHGIIRRMSPTFACVSAQASCQHRANASHNYFIFYFILYHPPSHKCSVDAIKSMFPSTVKSSESVRNCDDLTT